MHVTLPLQVEFHLQTLLSAPWTSHLIPSTTELVESCSVHENAVTYKRAFFTHRGDTTSWYFLNGLAKILLTCYYKSVCCSLFDHD